MKLALFDIDGTLINCGGIGRRSFDQAFQKVEKCNIPKNYSLAGKTDKQIIIEILRSYNFNDEKINSVEDTILFEYSEILKKNIHLNDFNKKIYPGVRSLLESLFIIKDKVICGLLTGNLIHTAKMKLEMFDLHNYFLFEGELFGGFGSDHHERSELVNIAIKRANKRSKYNFEDKNICIIGDTDNDILCGKHLNVKSIAVATGEWKMEDLIIFEPDFLFNDLSNTEKIIEAILS